MNRFRGGIIGMSVGDALGTAVEFMSREYVKNHKDTSMRGGGKFDLKPGQFTDDTSMALCIAESLIKNQDFVPKEVLQNWLKWYNKGHFSSNGKCFDIGATTVKALLYCDKNDLVETKKAVSELSGNGALMRVLPLVLFFSYDFDLMMEKVEQNSKITHNALDSIDGTKYFAALLHTIINHPDISKDDLLKNKFIDEYYKKNPIKSKNIKEIYDGNYKNKTEEEIKGSGLISKTLEAVLYCFNKTNNFKDGVLEVINLGDDADTTGCILGALAGVFYKDSNIPKEWIEPISLLPLIEKIIIELFNISKVKKENKKYEVSEEYWKMYKDFIFLEEQSEDVRRKLNPCPKMYRSVDSFDKDIKEIEELFFKRENPSKEIWREFEKRFKDDREVVKNKFSMGRGFFSQIKKK